MQYGTVVLCNGKEFREQKSETIKNVLKIYTDHFSDLAVSLPQLPLRHMNPRFPGATRNSLLTHPLHPPVF